MNTAGTPNNRTSGQKHQQQFPSPQSVILGSIDPSSETGPVFGSYKDPSSKGKQNARQQPPYQSAYAGYMEDLRSNQYHDGPVVSPNAPHGQHQQQQGPNYSSSTLHQLQFDPQQTNVHQHQDHRFQQTQANYMQPPEAMGIFPPIHTITSNTTPTGQSVKSIDEPEAPKKAPRRTAPYNNNDHAPDIIDSFGFNGPSRERSSSFASNTDSSQSSSGYQAEFHGSILHNPAFSPPPPFPENLSVVKMRFFGDENAAVTKSTLPSFESIRHSGECMARFSMKSMIIKKWRPSFWITYGDHQVLFFRSRVDFEEWVSNPYLTKDNRDALVKLSVDFVNDFYKPSVNGYNVTNIHTKAYNRDGAL